MAMQVFSKTTIYIINKSLKMLTLVLADSQLQSDEKPEINPGIIYIMYYRVTL